MTAASSATIAYKKVRLFPTGYRLVLGKVTGNAVYPTAGGYNFRPSDFGLATILYVVTGHGFTGAQTYVGSVASDRFKFISGNSEAADNEAGVDGTAIPFALIGY